ncbi:MAG: hypothetical protein Q9207_002320 [Kuettlingeria erythrocarpa]
MVDTSHGLLTRPPTPPKDAEYKLRVGYTYQSTLGQPILLNTPDESPSSSEYFNGSGGRQKRVVFSPWTDYHKPVTSGNKTTAITTALRPLPRSKECVATHKSILKASTNNRSLLSDATQSLVLDPGDTIAVMLRSVSQHLRSATRDSRLDSYRTLQGCLSVYDEVPDNKSLIENLTGFLECIRRDVLAKQIGIGLPDAELGSYALKVLVTILYIPGLRDAVPYEFGTFIVEQAVSSMENRDTPKVMLDHYMQLLARQKLPPKVINPEKACQILSALNGIEKRVKGNRVVGFKLMIYHRLLLQAKNQMALRAEEWLEFLMSSLSSSIKDIRSRAIAFGTDAALELGTTAAVSQTCVDILNQETPLGSKMVDYLGTRMLELLNVKNEGLHAPQIWIIIILFLRGRRRQIERWEHLHSWFYIMERAFNSGDANVKIQANVTWNRLVSVINLDTSTSAAIIKVLRRPIASQLERKKNDNNKVKHSQQLARSTYCNFLYYAFPPGATYEQLDFYWDGFVTPILPIRPLMTTSDLAFSCNVLGALFDPSQPRVWDQDRAHQLRPMKPEELPCLDAKWIRSRAAKIIDILENLHLRSALEESGNTSTTAFSKTWQNFMKALGSAASKEIKVSMETMTAIAHIITMLHRYWTQSYNSSKKILPRLNLFLALVNELVTHIGFRPLTEKRLLHASFGSPFEAAETPSNRSGRPQGTLKSPITCLLDVVVNVTHVNEPAEMFRDVIQAFLEPALRIANGRRTHLAILSQLAQDIIPGRSENIGNLARLIFWECLAGKAALALALPQEKAHEGANLQYPGKDYREAVGLLELGIREFGYDIHASWKMLSDAVVKRTQTEVGHAGILLIYTEPLSKVMCEGEPRIISDDVLHCGTYILEHVRWPESRQALERVRKQLWGPGTNPRAATLLDPFDHLYPMVVDLLAWAYSNLGSLSVDAVTQFLSKTNSFLLACPASLRVACLRKMQPGLGVWIEDKHAVPARTPASEDVPTLRNAVRSMWLIVLDMTKSVAKPDSASLTIISELLSAGFRSRHESIVNDLIVVWNQIFGKADALQYPEELHRALSKLRSKVQIDLPGFVDDEGTEIMSSPFDFVESQDDDIDGEGEQTRHKDARFFSKVDAEQLLKRHPHVSSKPPPMEVLQQACGSTPRRKLRHDDSQIQFAAVESSPLMASTLESQHLTDHQREVREQQEQGAAAMFPDIRSSPRRSRSAERPPELVLHRKQAFSQQFDADAEPSPTSPPCDLTMTDFLGSSPTPRSSRISSIEPEVGGDPASSPPDSPPSIPIPRQPMRCKASPASTHFFQQTEASNMAGSPAQVAPNRPGAITVLPGTQHIRRASPHNITGGLEQRALEPDDGMRSGPKVFVDAAAHPLDKRKDNRMEYEGIINDLVTEVDYHATAAVEPPSTPDAANEHEKAAADATDLGSEGFDNSDDPSTQAPFTPSQDEQAREQLLRDLEEASSQAERQASKRRGCSSSPSRVGKKRKGDQNTGTERRVTTELPAFSRACEVVIEKRKPDERIDDCFIVDDRPAAGQGRSASPAIKQERSPSPAEKPHRFSRSTRGLTKGYARRHTRSMTSRESLRSSVEVVEDPLTPSARWSDPSLGRHEMFATEQYPSKRRRTEQHQDTESTIKECCLSTKHANRPANIDGSGVQSTHPPPTEGQTHYINDKDEPDYMTSSQIESIKALVLRPHDSLLASGRGFPSASSDGDTELNTPQDSAQQAFSAVAAQQGARSPGQRMLERFKRLLQDLGQVALWPEEEKEMVEVAVKVIRNVHEAGRKNGR